MKRTTEMWVKAYQDKDALWMHSGNPSQPHALLTSGKHSSGFFNSRRIIPDDNLMQEAATDLCYLFRRLGGNMTEVQGVVGPQTGAEKLAKLTSISISHDTHKPCFWASPEKGEIGGEKAMIFNDKQKELLQGSTVLLCEDVITTGGSIDLTEKAITDAGGTVLPYILVLVNRSGNKSIRGLKVISLIARSMPIWDPDNGEVCPLCAQGSEAIRPKDPQSWARLNAA